MCTVTATTHWAHGFDLDVLSCVVERFERHDGDCARGPFTAVTKPAVADWIERGELRDTSARVLCVERRVRRASDVRDFTGRPLLRLPVMSLHVRRIAFDDLDDCDELIERLRRERRAVLFEGWAERADHHEIARRAELSRVGTKVRSDSSIVALWARGVQCVRRDAAELIGMRRMRVDFDVRAAAAELSAVDEWCDHYSNYNEAHTWHAVSLRSYGGDALTIEKPSEMTRAWRQQHSARLDEIVQDTPLQRALPSCQRIVDSLPGRKQRVRLMRLSARRGELSRHTDLGDPDSGIDDDRVARVHVPLVTSSDVRFTSWQLDDGAPETITMRAGECWYLDTRKPHAATNTGDSDRVHLVIDVHSSAELRALL